jgi:hypothetical protein
LFSDTAVYCLADFISKSTIWLLNGHASMTPLLPLRVDPDGISVFRLLLSDIPTLPGLQFTKILPNPEKHNIHSIMYFVLVSQPFCIIKAHSFSIFTSFYQVYYKICSFDSKFHCLVSIRLHKCISSLVVSTATICTF